MPPLGSASKSKGKKVDARRSRSRNTTPSSVLSASAPTSGPTTTPLLELETSKLLVSPKPNYGEIIDYLETHGTKFEPKSLHDLIDQLKHLSDAAEKRAESCEKAIRLIHEQKKEIDSDHQERERQAEQARRTKARKEESQSQKNPKAKKRKDRQETFDSVEIKREADEPSKTKIRAANTPGPVDSPSPSKKTKLSPGTSSLSEVVDSPDAAAASAHASPTKSDVSMSDAEENRVIHRQPRIPQQGFFPDPLAPDPVIYHIRDVTPGMSEEERKEIYGVTSFPTRDLKDEMAGTPPDKDFSNAKPTNQVSANTFLTFVEPYVRPLIEEDMAFLRERGDRTTPFLAVPRGKRSYQEIWAEEDGTVVVDGGSDKSPGNHPRGSMEQISDDNLATDQVSTGPLASRLLSLLKFEHRAPAIDTNGIGENAFNADGNDTMDLDGLMNGHDPSEKPLAPAAAIADLAGSKASNSQRLDYVQTEDRIKGELRHLGLLGQDENPDYDAHHDDDISERLRLLQAELRRVMITNGARKARLLDLAKERLAYQEYSTIHEDLDSQVQQAYLKRTRTLGKTKKGGPGAKPRPGVAGPGTALSLSRARDIGDSARMLMDRRKRWETCIGPVFKDMKHGIPEKDTTIWESKAMEAYEKAELEALEEEAE
ncbi:Transcriptional regulator [Elasticomyces elasticus]|uniref:Transcriptional regulator n=1 Tax=Exophiala sideris TaxID=1016849 RepID=A0ABR0JHR9_9EURO|nr:Transcriptional regulator [Elasticomyces elasticus]KAK5025718.1 Transcriptional regulator [Exophiala sideris]KAK5033073.1 Transcriptional regulator [Exophiala sideris]KAK5063558.1 Transcriptional regulator [Exophiala sideris]KAK5180609.1 Transcriptional regulator [Eurotiomycetes sp. CCFEE 6388]